MEKKLSYSALYHALDELYNKLKNENYSNYYLSALEDAKKSLLVLELLNLSRSQIIK